MEGNPKGSKISPLSISGISGYPPLCRLSCSEPWDKTGYRVRLQVRTQQVKEKGVQEARINDKQVDGGHYGTQEGK